MNSIEIGVALAEARAEIERLSRGIDQALSTLGTRHPVEAQAAQVVAILRDLAHPSEEKGEERG